MQQIQREMERICLHCQSSYMPFADPYVHIFDVILCRNVTYELCLPCIQTFTSCNECHRALNELYDIICIDVRDTYDICTCACCFRRNLQQHAIDPPMNAPTIHKCGISTCHVCYSTNEDIT